MLKHPIYLIYGVLLLALCGFAEYRGYSLNRVDRVNNLPKTIRNNPGAYRSHYRPIPRYFGGK